MNDPLAPLRVKFRERTKHDLARLKDLSKDNLACAELKHLAHNIAGAAGTFGHAELSRAAMAIDDRFAAGLAPDEAQIALLEQRLREVSDGD